MIENLSFFIALGAGLLSFLSPCVLPLIPSYLFLLGGMSASRDKGQEHPGGKNRRRFLAATICFILGFSAVFIALSVIFAVSFSLMGRISRYINWAAGAVVIILGFNFIFDFFSFLNYEKRFRIIIKPGNFIGAFFAGAAFGAGWTPCVGPILGSILLLAGQSGEMFTAVLYLAAYSLGLGLPFLAAAVFFDWFMNKAGRLQRYIPLIKKISGILLIIIGILIFSGRFAALNILLNSYWLRRAK
jgi:cytochrome c-type biogenesis protein